MPVYAAEGSLLAALQLAIFKAAFTSCRPPSQGSIPPGKGNCSPKGLRKFLVHFRGFGHLGAGLTALAVSLFDVAT